MKYNITYHREGDYLLPDLLPPDAPKIGVWGMRRRDYLKKYHGGIYTGMLLSGKLNAHLEEIDRSANEMFDLLIQQYAAREGVTEELKAQDQVEWVRRMNGIRERATEAILADLILADYEHFQGRYQGIIMIAGQEAFSSFSF